MHLPNLDYVRAASPQGALDALAAAGDAEFLAGGHSVVPRLAHRDGKLPRTLVDISRLTALAGVAAKDDMTAIGAATRLANLAHRDLNGLLPRLLLATIRSIANATVRNRATIGGNIGARHPQSQLPACLVALGARIELLGKAGARATDAAAYLAAAEEGDPSHHELITHVIVPQVREDDWASLLEIRPRNQDYPILGLAAVGRKVDGHVDDLKLVFFGNGAPVFAEAASAELSGKPWDESLVATARARLPTSAHWRALAGASAAYRAHAAGVLLQRMCGGEGWL